MNKSIERTRVHGHIEEDENLIKHVVCQSRFHHTVFIATITEAGRVILFV